MGIKSDTQVKNILTFKHIATRHILRNSWKAILNIPLCHFCICKFKSLINTLEMLEIYKRFWHFVAYHSINVHYCMYYILG